MLTLLALLPKIENNAFVTMLDITGAQTGRRDTRMNHVRTYIDCLIQYMKVHMVWTSMATVPSLTKTCLQILGYQNDCEFLGKHIHELIPSFT